jgi:hypothetical protein
VKAILVCHQEPRPVGHGGHRRAYQIRKDLEEALGAGNVLVSDNPWKYFPGWTWRTVPYHARRVLGPFVENPLKFLVRTRFTRRLYALPAFLNHYESLVRSTRGPIVSIVEHAGFSAVLPLNERLGIPTIACSQNLEAFDMSDDLEGPWALRAKAIDLASELEVLARCDYRLFISRVEAGLMGGLGLSGEYYPYLPRGAVRKRLEDVHRARSEGATERGLFLMLGTVGHESTRASFRWFVENAKRYGLPEGIRVVVGGLHTETLLPPDEEAPGVKLLGWLGEDDLDRLMARVTAALVPQRQGFGALTRLPELSCAGVPALVSQHATYALDIPPGIETVEESWDAWCARMEDFLSRSRGVVEARDYVAWEAKAPRSLTRLVQRLDGISSER